MFVLEEGEQEETTLVQMETDTGDAMPKRQPVRPLLLQPDRRLYCYTTQANAGLAHFCYSE